jgi:hypothetical protein
MDIAEFDAVRVERRFARKEHVFRFIPSDPTSAQDAPRSWIFGAQIRGNIMNYEQLMHR